MIKALGVERFADRADAAVHHIAGRHHVGADLRVRQRGFYQKIDCLIVEHMEMIAVDARHAAMSVAHVFTQTNIRDDDDFRTFLFDRSHRFLHDSIFGVSAGGLFVFFFGNSEKQDRLQPEVLRAFRFIDNLVERKLKNPRHARDRSSLADLFAHEQRQNEIVSCQVGLADEISKSRRTPQSAWTVDQFSHEARLRISR